ncbi:MAG TPA: hypothetical protein VMT03_01630 [Polyangia bacterium]|nr:hypothetical protein [Polyangia bacterium]
MRSRLVFVSLAVVAASCSSNGGGGSPGTGGTVGSGGTRATGGAPATGGVTATGGATATGGVTSTGGTGGSIATGGVGGGQAGAAGGPAVGSGGGSGGGAPGGGGSAGAAGGDCTRADLQAAVNAYLAALVAHDPTMAPLADSVRYTENTKDVNIGDGLWKTAGAVSLQRDLLDTVQCMTVTQVVLPESGTNIVFTQRLKLDGGKITESEAIITRPGDWNFDAQGYLNTKSKTWDILPANQQTPRDVLITMPKLYWDYFLDNTTPMPPFASDCTRVEGGKGSPVPCTTGIPSGVTISDRRYWADEQEGVAAGVSIFGGSSGLLDVHYFRTISGKIENVYAMTVNTSYTATGWPGGTP